MGTTQSGAFHGRTQRRSKGPASHPDTATTRPGISGTTASSARRTIANSRHVLAAAKYVAAARNARRRRPTSPGLRLCRRRSLLLRGGGPAHRGSGTSCSRPGNGCPQLPRDASLSSRASTVHARDAAAPCRLATSHAYLGQLSLCFQPELDAVTVHLPEKLPISGTKTAERHLTHFRHGRSLEARRRWGLAPTAAGIAVGMIS